MIKVIDYGLGNIHAFLNVYKRIGIPAARASIAADLDGATHVILPGVGSFDHAMTLFNASGFREALERRISRQDIRLLGVCVGMQMLAEKSEEGILPGLGWIGGTVKKFESGNSGSSLRLPHMGWNDVASEGENPLFAGLHGSARFYFLHSYFFDAAKPESMLATSDYGCTFDCAVGNGAVYGVQFHPEKSHHWGQAFLTNFARV